MDPCSFVRVLVGNLSLQLPVATRPARVGVHPSSSPCYCKIQLNSLPYQIAPITLLPSNNQTLAACFNLSKSDIDKINNKSVIFCGKPSRLKVAIYTGRRGSSFGVDMGRLLGKVTLPMNFNGVEGKSCVFHNGWVSIGGGGGKESSTMLHLMVKSEPDPRFVFEFDGEPECSPQVFQVQGGMRQPVFTCKFSCRSFQDRQTRSLPIQWMHRTKSWFSSFGSQREREQGKERKGWTITVHDLSGSQVALASMTTPFVPSPGTDRVSRSNPGAWLILRPGDHTWKPWGRLEAWREQNGVHDGLGYRFQLLPDTNNMNGAGISLIESRLNASKGGKFSIDLTRSSLLSPMTSPATSGDWGMWEFMGYRGFVMSATVQGEGKCSKPVVEVGVQHVGCTEDAAAFVAVAASMDLSMDACRLFSRRLRKELRQEGSF